VISRLKLALLTFLGLCALVCGTTTGQDLVVQEKVSPGADAEAKALELLAQLGARLRWQAAPTGKQLVMVDLKDTRVQNEQLQVLGVFKELREVYLHNTAITDAGLKDLAAARGLDTIWLSWTKVTQDGLKDLAAFPNLRTLRLGGLPITDAGLKDLAPLKNLQTLWLDWTKITDAGLKELLALENLEELRLDGTKVTSAGLKELAAFKRLKRVDMNGTNVIGASAEDLKTSKERLLHGHTGPVHCLRFTPDGRRLVSSSGWPGNDNSVRIWDLDTNQELYRIQAPGQVGALILSADGRYAIAGGQGALLYIDVATGQVLKRITGNNTACASLELSADGRYFYSASHDGIARRWDLAEGVEVAQYRVAGKWARFAGELPNQRVVTVDDTGLVQFWDMTTGLEVKRLNTGPVWLSSAILVPDRRHILTGTWNATSWDLETGSKEQACKGHKGDVGVMALSPDGKVLLTASMDGTARLWDFRSGSPLAVLLTQEEFLFAAAFSPDGRLMAVAGGGSKKGNDYTGGSAHDIHIFERQGLIADSFLVPPSNANTPQIEIAAPPSASGSWLKGGALIFLIIVVTGVGLFVVLRRRREQTQEATPPEATPPVLAFTCAHCGQGMRLKAENAGKKAKCPKCGNISRAPAG